MICLITRARGLITGDSSDFRNNPRRYPRSGSGVPKGSSGLLCSVSVIRVTSSWYHAKIYASRSGCVTSVGLRKALSSQTRTIRQRSVALMESL